MLQFAELNDMFNFSACEAAEQVRLLRDTGTTHEESGSTFPNVPKDLQVNSCARHISLSWDIYALKYSLCYLERLQQPPHEV